MYMLKLLVQSSDLNFVCSCALEILEEGRNHAVQGAEHSSDLPKALFSFQWNSTNIKPLLSTAQDAMNMQLMSHV